MQKKFIVGTLATAIAANNLVVPQIFADENKSVQQTKTVENTQEKNEQPSTPYTSLGAQTKLMEVSALMVVKQPVIKVDAVPNYMIHQQKVKEHANDWLDNYNKKLLESSESVMDFDRTFNAFYPKLSKLTKEIKNDESRRTFLKGLSLIQQKMKTVHESFNNNVTNVNDFQNLIKEDFENYQKDSEKIEETLIANDKSIKDLTAQIQTINSDITKDTAQIIASSAAITGGMVQIVVGSLTLAGTIGTTAQAGIPIIIGGVITTAGGIGGVTTGSIDFDKQNKQLVAATRKLSDAQALAVNLTLAKNQTSNFIESVSNEKTAFENVNKEWKKFNDRVNDLSESVKNPGELDSVQLQQKLNDIRNDSASLSKKTKEFTDFVLNSKVVEKI
ncbi:HBL/NHE enterotoxin family protein [Bacillus mycoides]|uniref:HBL/NHE enterotoxin family protein n=1 Tax=Bacillus mycoides TaxID=1405 RepID=UPI003D6591BB